MNKNYTVKFLLLRQTYILIFLENVADIIGQDYASSLETAWKYKHPFKFTITVNVPQLVSDFSEDLEFRFSLGISSIFRRLMAFQTGRPITAVRRHEWEAARVRVKLQHFCVLVYF